MSLGPLQVEELDSSPPSHHPDEVTEGSQRRRRRGPITEEGDGPEKRGEATTHCYLSCQSRHHKGGVFFDLSALKAAVLVYLIDSSVIIVNIVNLFF